MNKLLATTILSLAVAQAQAHSRPGIDNLTHRLEHLTINHLAMPASLGIGLLMLALLAFVIRQNWRPQ
ncbi:hypothetical protein [Methylomonas sp. MgM2]